MTVHFLFYPVLFLSVFIIRADWRDKEIPLFWLIGFMFASAIYFLFENFSYLFLGVITILAIFLLWAESKNWIGMADCLLIPSCMMWLSLETIPLFFISCGFLGVMTAFYWRQKHQDKAYPFTPAILISWVILFL